MHEKTQEIERLRWLIECNPADVKLLKKEYEQLTGKKYRRKNGGQFTNICLKCDRTYSLAYSLEHDDIQHKEQKQACET